MIVILNRAFGIGKNNLANYLASNLENSMIYDPKEIGALEILFKPIWK